MREKIHDTTLHPDVNFGYPALSSDEKRRDFPPCLWDVKSRGDHVPLRDETQNARDRVIEQVWFAGVHSDVGGWYDERRLSNIALQWMAEKGNQCKMPIDGKRLKEYIVDPNGKKHESTSGFWKFRGRHFRKIPKGAFIHKSVIGRMNEKKNKYQPQNLPKKYKTAE